MNKELIFLRTFAASAAVASSLLFFSSFKGSGYQQFESIDVQRINVVEADGTTKMIITNAGLFPTGNEKINGRPTNTERKKRAGMLFFNEDGIEAGGLIYDGSKRENGHSAGLSLTFDQYDGDQVMQLLTTDTQRGEDRFVSSTLVFNDRPAKESQEKTAEIMNELRELRKSDPEAFNAKYAEYQAQELIGGSPRIMLGKSRSQNNGLFLFDDQGRPRAMFYLDKDNQPKLEAFDEAGNITSSWPASAN
ncbi:hypothetical protein J0A67_21910 [Algoriphagus aestuariicola]|jgi:hypothetical protein|uniref:Uncharacterized protein n=1 Tax=Algoriphagus aestuariicola TaxID=1852016 RepID=A0ABS3BWU1_9BACT|nr:hypothetical protein [Algoriphagus aestuariicola]MBN7803540.1 hypothetical protein [Algoriphagus aestuariicola]